MVLIAIELAREDRRALVLLVLPVAIGIAAIRAFANQAKRHDHLEFLYESMKATQGAPEFSLAVGQLLVAVRQLVRAEYAEIFLFAAGSQQGLRSTLGAQGEMNAHADVVSPADAQVLAALGAGPDAILLSASRPPHSLDGYLAARTLPDAIIAALRGEDGVVRPDRRRRPLRRRRLVQRRRQAPVRDVRQPRERDARERPPRALAGRGDRPEGAAAPPGVPRRPHRAAEPGPLHRAGRSRGGARRRAAAAVLFLDLDDFKAINDTLGHAVGDEVLAEVGRRVQRAVRPADTAARLGGDEFAVLLDTTDRHGSEVVAESLLRALRRPLTLRGREARVHGSIGIAPASSAGERRRAPAERRRRDVRGEEHRQALLRALRAEDARAGAPPARVRASRSQGAVERDEIVAVFEPIVDLRDGRIVGFEALARWDSPERGARPAGRLHPRRRGDRADVRDRLERAAPCLPGRAPLAWTTYPAHRDVDRVGQPLAERARRARSSPDNVARALFEARLPAEKLMLEITESDVMWDLDIAHRRMDELRALGVRLVLDDFGTGRSSLERLDTFPLDAVKIAKPFVDRLLDPASESSFIDAFVSLAQSLEVAVHRRGDRARRPGADAARPRLLARPGLPFRAADERDRARPVPAARLRAPLRQAG